MAGRSATTSTRRTECPGSHGRADGQAGTSDPVRARDVALAAATDRVVPFRFDSIQRTTCGRGRTSGGDDDLSAGVAVSEVADRLWNLVEWERPVDDRLDGAGFEQLPQLFQVLAALL
jgi:hypothetical protein